eukprot:gene2719-2760_t
MFAEKDKEIRTGRNAVVKMGELAIGQHRAVAPFPPSDKLTADPARAELARAELATVGNTRLNLVVALSYGSRGEIVAAVQAAIVAAAEGRLDAGSLTEETFPTPWRDLRVRVLSAVVLGPIGIAALWLGGTAWNALIVLLALGMATEWTTISRTTRLRRRQTSLAILAAGLLYLLPATIALIWMRADPQAGRANVLFIVLVVWASDIGAYLAGRLFGGPRLAPLVSPGKTWSGAAGGLLSAALVGVAAAALGSPGASGYAALHAATLAGALGIAAQIGDLLESALKRQFGVKDSGWLIPGHGGLLDRLDGMLMAAPLAAILILTLGRGVTLVGTQTVELLLANPALYRVRALVAGSNVKLLAEQAVALRAEIAVAYLQRRIGFLDIAAVVEQVMLDMGECATETLDAVISIDRIAREKAQADSPVFEFLPSFLRTPIAFAIVLGILVFIHEMGHYLAARWRGVHVEAFSIGFGGALFSWTDRLGTVWKLCWLPLGGYVKLHGQEQPQDATPETRAAWQPGRTFHEKSVLSRAIVVAAGPIANFILAALLFAILFTTTGRPVTQPVFGEVLADSAAARAGLLAGDRVDTIDGKKVDKFEDIQAAVGSHPGEPISMAITRDGKPLTLTATPDSREALGRKTGVLGGKVTYQPVSAFEAIPDGIAQTWTVATQTLGGVWQMISGQRGTDDLGGPLRIAQLSGQVAQLGFASLISFIAVLSA